MPTIKAVTRPKKDSDGQVPIYIRISDSGKTRYVSTGLKIKPKFWNDRKRAVRENDYYDAGAMNKIIRDKIKEIKDERYRLKAENQAVNADILKRRAKADELRGDYLEHADRFAERKYRNNIQTGKKYRAIVAKIKEYTGGRLPFREITVTWLKEYSDWLATEKENNPNTIHSNLRGIRAILYDAIREGLFPQEKNPFFKLKLKQPKVSRTKLNTDEIKAIAKAETENDIQSLSKDMFLFSFFTCGMRFRDVATLRWENIEGDQVRYETSKTGSSHSVKLFPPAKAILDNYRPGKPTDYIFPLLDTSKKLKDPLVLDNDISSKNAYVNGALKEVAGIAELSKHVHYHVARHSYADISRRKGVDLHSISNSLGHQSLKTTENYLNALDNQTTEQAVSKVYEEF